MENKDKIKSRIVQLLSYYGSKSMPALVEGEEMMSGMLEVYWTGSGNPNVLIVAGVNAEFIAAYTELISEGKISGQPTSLLDAVMDGTSYNLPFWKNSYKKRKCWLPYQLKINWENGND